MGTWCGGGGGSGELMGVTYLPLSHIMYWVHSQLLPAEQEGADGG